MKKVVCLLLCFMMLLSEADITWADVTQEEEYETLKVEYSDCIGVKEELHVMVKENHLYVNAQEIGNRLGYDVNITEEYVSIYNQEYKENVPYGLTIFYFDSKQIEHMLFNKMLDSYKAPFESIKNEEGAWIPLEYSLLILNSSMLILDNKISIDMPSKDIIDIYMDILKCNEEFLFDWQEDIGLDETNENKMGKSAIVVSVFNGLLTEDGYSWAQYIQSFALDSSSYDQKYGEKLAMLFCTYSDDELNAEVKKIKEFMSHFNGKGALGQTINAIDKELDKEIGTLLKTSENLKKQIDASNKASIVAYNKSYQALEKACDSADIFSNATELYTKVGKSVSEATRFLDSFYLIAEVVGYASEFQNQDKFSVEALTEFVEKSKSKSIMSNAMKEGITDYTDILKSNVVQYSALRYMEKEYENLAFKAIDKGISAGLEAELLLIAWDVMSSNFPFYKEGLGNTDSFLLSMYASIFQADAFVSYQRSRDELFSDGNEITPEQLYETSQYCYIYLKSCYITREAALGSLTEETNSNIPNLLKSQKAINVKIAIVQTHNLRVSLPVIIYY